MAHDDDEEGRRSTCSLIQNMKALNLTIMKKLENPLVVLTLSKTHPIILWRQY